MTGSNVINVLKEGSGGKFKFGHHRHKISNAQELTMQLSQTLFGHHFDLYQSLNRLPI